MTPETAKQTTGYAEIRVVRDLKDGGANRFELTPDATARVVITNQIGAIAIRKLRFKGELRAHNKSDWRLEATLGATVDQACVVTAQKVTTRVDVPVIRLFQNPTDEELQGGEVEFDGEDEIEPLTEEIDLGAILSEALLLALPDYPRIEGAQLQESVFTEPGITPLGEAEAKPFAALAALRDKLQK
ncbi:MAG: DUF177 domain-containing protein [Alphaproteobacteria bacterium]|nr:DUF177 domain-containing protein [Alphaproteobacteria bacterium]